MTNLLFTFCAIISLFTIIQTSHAQDVDDPVTTTEAVQLRFARLVGHKKNNPKHHKNSQAEDQPAQDEPAQDEPAQDQPAQDEPAQDEPAEDEPAHDQSAEAQPAQDEKDKIHPIDHLVLQQKVYKILVTLLKMDKNDLDDNVMEYIEDIIQAKEYWFAKVDAE